MKYAGGKSNRQLLHLEKVFNLLKNFMILLLGNNYVNLVNIQMIQKYNVIRSDYFTVT